MTSPQPINSGIQKVTSSDGDLNTSRSNLLKVSALVVFFAHCRYRPTPIWPPAGFLLGRISAIAGSALARWAIAAKSCRAHMCEGREALAPLYGLLDRQTRARSNVSPYS